MELEPNPQMPGSFHFTPKDIEIAAVKGAYAEKFASLARENRTDEISNTSLMLSQTQESMTPYKLNVEEVDNLIDTLQDFTENTNMQVVRASESVRPDFLNDTFALRIKLGKIAATMAAECRLRKEAIIDKQVEDGLAFMLEPTTPTRLLPAPVKPEDPNYRFPTA